MDLVTRCRRGLLAASIVAGVVSGCTDAAGPNEYNASLAPGAGSIYAVDVYPTDSFGNKKSSTGVQDTIHPTPVVAVAGVPATFGDAQNVISFDVPQIVSLSNTGLLDRYFRYLSNGNVEVFRQKGTLSMPGVTIPLDSMWIELPFGTKSKRTWTEVDTMWVTSGNKTNKLTVTWTVAFDKVETLLGAIAPTPLAVFRPDPALTALRVYAHREEILSTPDSRRRIWSEDTYWFTPKTKYLVQKTHGRMTINTTFATSKVDTTGQDGYLWSSYYYNVK